MPTSPARWQRCGGEQHRHDHTSSIRLSTKGSLARHMWFTHIKKHNARGKGKKILRPALDDSSPGTYTVHLRQHQDNFVFRKVQNVAGKVSMTDQPATYEMFDSRLKRLGLAANIGVHLTSYAFRRLADNAVNRPEVTVEDRRSLMGHNIASRVFRAYIARTTQVDVQGLITKGSVDRTALASAGRLSHAYDLPKAISAKGKASVFARQDVQDLSAKSKLLVWPLRHQRGYGSLA